MHTAIGFSAAPVSEHAIIRKPGVDFDLKGSKSSLTELFQLGGLFPLAKIADRLPFSVVSLRNWSKQGPYTDCFVRPHVGSNGYLTSTLIHLDRIEERIQAFVLHPREEDENPYLAEVTSVLGLAGNLAV